MTNGLYRVVIPAERAAPATESAPVEGERVVSADEWHRAMGHVSHEVAREMLRKERVLGVRLDPRASVPSTCESCEAGKMTRKPIAKTRVRPCAAEVGDELHSDVWGPAPKQTIGGCQYDSLFID
ncbi:uncharacterized protein TRAVEDRAFT_127480, partial [Trametes versicolor FP-101664 SS1]|uniref:uncharacterized protein n=1 Tax=Trametes versicolor (strain FP-101664) TaxID=717944 RepID=UPI0004623607